MVVPNRTHNRIPTLSRLALIVEDDSMLRSLYEMVLTQHGFTVMHAVDGSQAMQMLHEYTPDVVFLDMLLPRMPGSAILEYIHTYLQNTRCVVVTAHEMYRQLIGPLDVFLLKPMTYTDIQEAMQALMGVAH
jgi:DNA-binding NtrC family response regulator